MFYHCTILLDDDMKYAMIPQEATSHSLIIVLHSGLKWHLHHNRLKVQTPITGDAHTHTPTCDPEVFGCCSSGGGAVWAFEVGSQ